MPGDELPPGSVAQFGSDDRLAVESVSKVTGIRGIRSLLDESVARRDAPEAYLVAVVPIQRYAASSESPRAPTRRPSGMSRLGRAWKSESSWTFGGKYVVLLAKFRAMAI